MKNIIDYKDFKSDYFISGLTEPDVMVRLDDFIESNQKDFLLSLVGKDLLPYFENMVDNRPNIICSNDSYAAAYDLANDGVMLLHSFDLTNLNQGLNELSVSNKEPVSLTVKGTNYFDFYKFISDTKVNSIDREHERINVFAEVHKDGVYVGDVTLLEGSQKGSVLLSADLATEFLSANTVVELSYIYNMLNNTKMSEVSYTASNVQIRPVVNIVEITDINVFDKVSVMGTDGNTWNAFDSLKQAFARYIYCMWIYNEHVINTSIGTVKRKGENVVMASPVERHVYSWNKMVDIILQELHPNLKHFKGYHNRHLHALEMHHFCGHGSVAKNNLYIHKNSLGL